MPGPAAVPFLVVNPAVMHAVLAVGRHVVTAGSVEAASSATLAYVLALALWKRVPDWIREDVGLQNLLPKKKNLSPSEHEEYVDGTCVGLFRLEGCHFPALDRSTSTILHYTIGNTLRSDVVSARMINS